MSARLDDRVPNAATRKPYRSRGSTPQAMKLPRHSKRASPKGGGTIVKELNLPFPGVEFQALLTEIVSLKPDATFAFFAGGGAVKFVKDYAATGLMKSAPLYGPGFLTDGTLEAQGESAQGLLTTLHYADDLPNAKDKTFRLSYAKAYKLQPDVYAAQGYDAAQLLAAGLSGVKGDSSKRAEMIKAMETAKIDSPRGAFAFSKAHHPVHDIYLRKVEGGANKYQKVAGEGTGRSGDRLQDVAANGHVIAWAATSHRGAATSDNGTPIPTISEVISRSSLKWFATTAAPIMGPMAASNKMTVRARLVIGASI